LKLRFDINGRFATTNRPNGFNANTTNSNQGIMFELSQYNYSAPYYSALQNPNGSYGYGVYKATGGGGIASTNLINELTNGGITDCP